MQSYTAEIVYQKAGQHDTESSITIQFLAAEHVTAALMCGRWFENRHKNLPMHFTRLLCVKVYILHLQTFRPDGYLPSDNGGCVYEYKCDTAGLPYEEHVRYRLNRF